ncbi:MAG: [protein-PII] uridylyltransferase [Alphaproteobacteria bacterium]|nr:[protein-PII] uridylyltransferase [Alphaproteobacteria bacterium]
MPNVAVKAPQAEAGFICKTGGDIIAAVLAALGDGSPNSTRARSLLLDEAKAALALARRTAETELIRTRRGIRCARQLCMAQDEIIGAIHEFATQYVYPDANPSEAEAVALAAVGGYGRATLAPGSDIDLLFILPYKQTPWGEQITEYILYMLWDLGQKVGHAVRSVDDCIRMAKADMTVRTATLESRFLTGQRQLYDKMVSRFHAEVVTRTGPEFIAAKLAERDERHRQMGNSRYVVEPNIKDGKGGLRDLNTLFWIGKYFYHIVEGADFVDKGVLSRSELRMFERSEDFLWAVRCNLHYLTRRADEKITFDLQPDLAERMGYADRPGMLGVERFMKHYFLVAKNVGDLTRIFCASIEVSQGSKPILERVLEGWTGGRRKKIRGETDFFIDRGRLNVVSPDVFANDPVNLIRVFWVSSREDLIFHPDALKHITRSLPLINRELRTDETANRHFRDILTTPKSVERVLRRMNESGVLGKFVPEFGRIVALMQFNMYHHYTVDEHLIRAVGVMADIMNGGLTKEFPLTHELLPQLSGVNLLFIALFLHDIAKGRDEDHSIAGARIARKFCPRLGLTAAETETVSWLVRYHLTMSEVAQARDIQDPETARGFAELVQSPNRLGLLMILTACDIRAVGPGVWTGWKGSLLRSLYYATEPLISGGHSQVSQADRIEDAKKALAVQLDGWSEEEIAVYQARHYSPYWLRAEPVLQVTHAKMIRDADRDGKPFAGSIEVKSFESITEVTFYTPDHPRLLSIIAGACTMCEASIIGAQIFSMRDGQALDTFRLRRAFTSDEDEKVRAHRIIDTVRDLLQGKRRIPADLGHGSRLNKRLKPFHVPSEVHVSNALSSKFTVIEVCGLDRSGLLHHLTRALSDLNLTIGSAHISTFGEKVVDVFYVTDLTGYKIEAKARERKVHDRLMQVLENRGDAE